MQTSNDMFHCKVLANVLHDVLHESNGLTQYPVQLFRIIEQVMKHNFEKSSKR